MGDNEEVVDEKFWDADDDDKDQGGNDSRKEDKYEKNAPIQVEDKTNLEYMTGDEDQDQQVDKDKQQEVQEKQKQQQQVR